jgi:hypothetical protein
MNTTILTVRKPKPYYSFLHCRYKDFALYYSALKLRLPHFITLHVKTLYASLVICHQQFDNLHYRFPRQRYKRPHNHFNSCYHSYICLQKTSKIEKKRGFSAGNYVRIFLSTPMHMISLGFIKSLT